MKLILLFIISCLGTVCITAQHVVEFESEQIHLGKIKKGEKVSGAFTFTNVSDEDVEISLVSTCDCTEASWPYDVIKPQETAQIEFVFDSNEKDKEEPVDVDVFFKNVDPKTGNPYTTFLSYTFEFEE